MTFTELAQAFTADQAAHHWVEPDAICAPKELIHEWGKPLWRFTGNAIPALAKQKLLGVDLIAWDLPHVGFARFAKS